MYTVIVSHRPRRLEGGANYETLDDGGEILAGLLAMLGDFEWEDVDIHIVQSDLIDELPSDYVPR